jgi:threonine dehydrogenase-like Zn-dependent dehydrogenase
MRAVTCTNGVLDVADLPDPRPAEGQVLLEVVRAGICGSDLHARLHCDELAEVTREAGYDGMMRAAQSVVLGHELAGRVLEHGPGTRRRESAGQVVVAMPLIRHAGRVHPVGLSKDAPGAFAEQVLVQESLMIPVPDSLAPEHAALTEPMAVALHAVRRGQVGRNQVAVVIGCGPVGLAVVAMLKATGVRRVVAADPSPRRRRIAELYGADVVVDPARESPFDSARGHGYVTTVAEGFDRAVEGMTRLRRLPRWWDVYRVAERAGLASPRSPVVFECVGVAGMIDQLVGQAPLASRVVVVGVCMGMDRFRPAMAVTKELELRFVLGYTALDFRDALRLLAERKVDAAPMVTGTVGIDGVGGAFAALADPERHVKVLVDPAS